MSANGISTLLTKQERQEAKLALAKAKREIVGTNGFRARNAFDITQLPTQYSGNDLVDNPNVGGLIEGRPWITQIIPISDPLAWIQENYADNSFWLGATFADVDSNGYIYTSGPDNTTYSGFTLSKSTPEGEVLWFKKITNNWYGWPTALAVCPNGNIIIGAGYGGLLSFDSSGNLLWQKLFTGATEIYCIVGDNSGNVYLGGWDHASNWDPAKGYLCKLDVDGNLLWHERLTDGSKVADIKLVNNELWFVLGNNFLGNANISDGSINWAIDGTIGDYVAGVEVDSSGNYYSVHTRYGDNILTVLHKTDSFNSVVWSKIVSGYAISMKKDSVDNIYALSTDYNGGILLYKFDKNGTLLWQRKLYSPTGYFYPSALGKNCLSLSEDETHLLVPITNDPISIVFSLPADGSLTGTYGSYEYIEYSSTVSSTNDSSSTISLAVTTPSATISEGNYTITDITCTVNIIQLAP